MNGLTRDAALWAYVASGLSTLAWLAKRALQEAGLA